MTTTTDTNNAPILTVSQFTNAIKCALETSFPSIWIQGEISNCKLQSSGHLYFSLKDSKAQISAVMFRAEMGALKAIPKDGDQVIVNGELNVYPPSGKYQIVVREMRQVGLGELLLKLEELKLKLHKKGWFKSEHKKPLPKSPQRIGVVTSPTGAVIQDIINILTRRVGGFHLILNPVRVQGEGAALEIAQAIANFNKYEMVDVMIVGRGGGSLEDLWAFNEEIVAEAIFNSHIPIISAVGHETDHCIADYVADVRAPTPSAAAEIVIAERAQQTAYLSQTQQRLIQCVSHLIRQDRHRLNGLLRQPILQSPYALVGPWMQRLDDIRQDLDEDLQQLITKKRSQIDSGKRHLQALRPSAQIAHFRQILRQKKERLAQAWNSKIESRRRVFNPSLMKKQLEQSWQRIKTLRQERLTQVVSALQAVDPKKLLTRGYCILFAEKDHSVITSITHLEVKEEIQILLSDGKVISTVKEIFPK